jgi:hypothetical protein
LNECEECAEDSQIVSNVFPADCAEVSLSATKSDTLVFQDVGSTEFSRQINSLDLNEWSGQNGGVSAAGL